MQEISDEKFQQLIDEALGSLPGEHIQNIKNLAILYQGDPTEEQRMQNNLNSHQTLLGLYEGVPLSQRQGMTMIYPDRITLFKNPLLSASKNLYDLKENIKHTLWHEIAHYYGLDHSDIAEKE